MAIKKFHTNQQLVSRSAELRYLRGLHHDNIVSLLGVTYAPAPSSSGGQVVVVEDMRAQSPGNYCLVLEYCSHGSLSKHLARTSTIHPRQLWAWCKQIAQGMHYLHSKSIIHRDLKSPNILITMTGHGQLQLKIADFGTSKMVVNNTRQHDLQSSLTVSTTSGSSKMSLAGTLAWMAPEVMRGECDYGAQVDVWSYGVVVWEMVTLRPPYAGYEETAIIYGVGGQRLCLPIACSFPSCLAHLIESCLAWSPDKRPSFEQILNDHLNRADFEQQINSIHPEHFERLQSFWKKHSV